MRQLRRVRSRRVATALYRSEAARVKFSSRSARSTPDERQTDEGKIGMTGAIAPLTTRSAGRRTQGTILLTVLGCVLLLGAVCAARASANEYAEGPVYIDPSLRTFYTAPFPTGSTTDVNLRWVDDPPHSSHMSINLCSNYGIYWERDFAAHSTAYHLMTTLPAGTCFVARGYSLTGAWTGVQELQYTT